MHREFSMLRSKYLIPILVLAVSWLCAAQKLPDPDDPLTIGEKALNRFDYRSAQTYFNSYLHDHPNDPSALYYAGDTALGLKQYELAARNYKQSLAQKPNNWFAHKNLVIVYAALGDWPAFDAERNFIQAARKAAALGLKPNDVDIIDTIHLGHEDYIVHASAELFGPNHVRYVINHYDPAGKLDLTLTCEAPASAQPNPEAAEATFALTEYAVEANHELNPATAKTLRLYPTGEPTYETIRTDTLAYLALKPNQTPSSGPLNPKPSPIKPK